MHQHDQRLPPIIFHDQGFDHAMLGHAQTTGAVRGPAMLLVGVEMAGKGNVVFSQQPNGWSNRKFFFVHKYLAKHSWLICHFNNKL